MSSVEWRVIEGIRIPFIGGLPLCSLRNPEREAEKWRQNQSACDFILIIGIGAGFHLKTLNSETVLIFDPCDELVFRAQESWPTLAHKMTSQKDALIHFMLHMPAVWIFRPAFNGRLSELYDIEDFLIEKEKHIGEKFLTDLKFRNLQTAWQSFLHRNVKFGIHHFPKAEPTGAKSLEDLHVDILRELVK